jgi:Cu(I)/Ag(I) efflux system membrane fusion protein
MKDLFNRLKGKILIGSLIVLAFLLGLIMSGKSGPSPDAEHDHAAYAEKKAATWTCSMHPQIKLPKPGKCPICFMDLIPLEGSDEDEGERELAMSHAAKKLAEIETAPVKRQDITAEIRMVGKVDYDESRVKTITARMPGRLERLFVDYTGIPVKKGDHLVEIYSPDLYTAQEELIQAIKANSAMIAMAAREKLSQWGLTARQIRAIESRGTARDRMTLYSPMSGIVIHKNAVEGKYVGTGARLYTIADLSKVWVKLEAYESDLSWLRYGQEVDISTESYPGKKFKGRISFIDPVLNPKTRTVNVRVNIENKYRKLKPEMFVTGIVKAVFASDGSVIDDYLSGKWISPMHPEIVKNRPGKCDICGMPLVRAETLGYGQKKKGREKPLVIPSSAPMITGKRAVVYVEKKDAEKPTYEGREVVLGPRAGNFYIVKSGIEKGESIVVNGAFKIDAEMQIQAKPSMMSPEGGQPAPLKVSKEFLEELENVYSVYFNAQAALAGDNFKKARQALNIVKEKVKKVNMKHLTGQAHQSWMAASAKLVKSLEHIMHLGNISAVREAFRDVSSVMIDIQKNFGHTGTGSHYVAFCPMAFNNKGGSWLQTEKLISNPFYGASMLRCGEIKEEIKKK